VDPDTTTGTLLANIPYIRVIHRKRPTTIEVRKLFVVDITGDMINTDRCFLVSAVEFSKTLETDTDKKISFEHRHTIVIAIDIKSGQRLVYQDGIGLIVGQLYDVFRQITRVGKCLLVRQALLYFESQIFQFGIGVNTVTDTGKDAGFGHQ